MRDGPGQAHRHGWRLEILDRLGSTNDLCIARAEAGEPAGLAVLARRQSAARGSRGRSWTEPPAGNLALSVLLRPVGPATDVGIWPFVAGLALHDGLRAVSDASLMLKWPNDLLLDGRKLAGILIERGFAPSGLWMVIGFGANLADAPVLPDRRAACLAELGPAPDQEQTAAAVLAALDRWRAVLDRDGFAPIREAWLRRAHPVGARLLLRLPPGKEALANGASDAQREGSFSGLAPDGALLVVIDGVKQRVDTGDVLLAGGG